MKKMLIALIVGIVFCAIPASQPVSAHHSQARYTDGAGAIEVIGVVARVEMTNPHSFIYIDELKDGKPVMKAGKRVRWALEMQSLRGLAQNGWVDNTVKVGETISVIGRPARNGSPAMSCEIVKLPDGRSIRS